MFCSACGSAVNDSMKFCANCGAAVGAATTEAAKPDVAAPAAVKKKRSVWPWFVGVPVGLFILLMIIGSVAGNSPAVQEHARQQRIKEECEKMLGDSAPGAERRMTRQICENMGVR